MVEHRNRVGETIRSLVEVFRLGVHTVEQPDIKVHLLQEFYQKGRGTGRKPVVLITLLSKSINQAERIVHIHTGFTEMISVILLLQVGTRLFIRFIVGLCHLFDINFHLCQQFLFGDTADSAVIIAHADVLKIVKFAGYAHLAEFADARQEEEAKIFT